MLEMFVFAVILTTVQVVAGLALVRLFMTEWFIQKYFRFIKKYMNKLIEMEFENEEEGL